MSGSQAHTAVPSSTSAQQQNFPEGKESPMSTDTTDTQRRIANDIWSICNLLRGPYKRNEYRKVILPLTVLRRFDGLLAPTKAKALETFNQ